MSALQQMWDEFLDKFERIPVWLPGMKMSLGDVGVIDKRGFIRLANLLDFDIEYATADSDTRPSYYVSSQNAATQDLDTSGGTSKATSAIVGVQAGMRATFTAAGGFIVRAENVQGTRIQDVLDVERKILGNNAVNPFWQKEWVYVSEVVTAEPCIVLISGSENAQAEVVGTIDLGPGGPGSLAHASAGLRLTKQAGIDQYIVSLDRMPFMWRGRWQRGWLGKVFRDRGGEAEVSGGSFADLQNPEVFMLEEAG